MSNATAEVGTTLVETTLPDLLASRYPGYRITPLFSCGKIWYYRVTKWGITAEGLTTILRSRFVKVKDGKITERQD